MPGSVLLEVTAGVRNVFVDPVVLAVGEPGLIDRHPRNVGAVRIERRESVVVPGLVNAHTHLDLTHMGPRAFDRLGGFAGWIDMIRRERLDEASAIRASVRRGVELSLAGGVVAIGDIAGAVGGRASPIAACALLEACSEFGVIAAPFVEFFAPGDRLGEPFGDRERASLDALAAALGQCGSDVGVQPHAPYSVSPEAYRRACAMARDTSPRRRVCTHLAESIEERDCLTHGSGPIASFLTGLGVRLPERPTGAGTSVAYLGAESLAMTDIAVHVNDASDQDIAMLATAGVSVVYCPRASEYFGHAQQLGPHRYRDMLAAGINVALGTDSIVNLDTPGRISTLDEMRLLYLRDGVEPRVLLEMVTTRGARALGLEESLFTFSPGKPIAGVVALRPERHFGTLGEMVLQEGVEIEVMGQRSGSSCSDSPPGPTFP